MVSGRGWERRLRGAVGEKPTVRERRGWRSREAVGAVNMAERRQRGDRSVRAAET